MSNLLQRFNETIKSFYLRISFVVLYCIALYLVAIYHKNVITYIQVCQKPY